jgi:hypothetical protein
VKSGKDRTQQRRRTDLTDSHTQTGRESVILWEKLGDSLGESPGLSGRKSGTLWYKAGALES